jgi:predicted ATPase
MGTRTLSSAYIVTGGPGAGKTTLLGELARRGYECRAEGARAIIQQQLAIDGPGLEWKSPGLVTELVLAWEMRTYDEVAGLPGPVFCDRGIPDLVSYCEVHLGAVPAHVLRAAQEWRYATTVFVAPPWPEIFTTDAERTQTAEFAAQVYAPLVVAYQRLGYDMVELPRVAPHERADFVISRL